MALKALMLRKKIDEKKKMLEEIRSKEADLLKREKDLEASIEEAQTEEEKATVEEEVNKFEEEKASNTEAKESLEKEVSELEEELHAEEESVEEVGDSKEEEKKEKVEERSRGKQKMEIRTIKGMNLKDTEAFVQREDVKKFHDEMRSVMTKRDVNNVALTIPEVYLGLIRENILEYSKLIGKVNLRAVSGDGRQLIMSQFTEAIWTDCCANLNELELTFYSDDFACWKVGGYFVLCNSNLEDSDVDLANEILRALGQAIGLAVDKAITYGTGVRMPLGIVTRIAQTAQPDGYAPTARPWVNLNSTNIVSIPTSATGEELFKQLALAFGAAKGGYSRGEKTFAMNEATYTNLVANAMSINASGAIVSGVNGTMPVLGGDIVVLNFIPDNVIIGGYYDLYTLVERAGNKFASSEHVRFLQDQTVFKGIARYDGKPTIAEGFVVIGLNGVTPTAEMTFAPDVANESVEEGA